MYKIAVYHKKKEAEWIECSGFCHFMDGIIVKIMYSPFAGDLLEPPQGPLRVPGTHFENHCSSRQMLHLLFMIEGGVL